MPVSRNGWRCGATCLSLQKTLSIRLPRQRSDRTVRCGWLRRWNTGLSPCRHPCEQGTAVRAAIGNHGCRRCVRQHRGHRPAGGVTRCDTVPRDRQADGTGHSDRQWRGSCNLVRRENGQGQDPRPFSHRRRADGADSGRADQRDRLRRALRRLLKHFQPDTAPAAGVEATINGVSGREDRAAAPGAQDVESRSPHVGPELGTCSGRLSAITARPAATRPRSDRSGPWEPCRPLRK